MFRTMLALTCAIAATGVSAQRPAARSSPSTKAPAPGPKPGAPYAGRPLLMDVAGVRLGMPASGIEAAIAGRYRCAPFGYAQSFAEQVESEVKRRRGKGGFGDVGSATASIICTGDSGAELKIQLAHPASGPIVREFRLSVSARQASMDDVARQFAAKYGRPDLGDARQGFWCEQAKDCVPGYVARRGAFVMIEVNQHGATIAALGGPDRDDAAVAAVQAAADRTAPKGGRVAL